MSQMSLLSSACTWRRRNTAAITFNLAIQGSSLKEEWTRIFTTDGCVVCGREGGKEEGRVEGSGRESGGKWKGMWKKGKRANTQVKLLKKRQGEAPNTIHIISVKLTDHTITCDLVQTNTAGR